MTKPGLVTRFAGSPLGALLLFAVYALVVYSWWRGEARWWMALGVVGAGIRTVSAISRVRAYKAWMRQWERMGQPDKPASRHDAPAPVRRAPRRGMSWPVVACSLVVVGFLLYASQSKAPTPPLLGGLWAACLLYLLFAFVRALVRKARGGATSGTVTAPGGSRAAGAVPVRWVMGRASSSPSREDVLGSLPAYSARLMLPEPKTRKVFSVKRETAKA